MLKGLRNKATGLCFTMISLGNIFNSEMDFELKNYQNLVLITVLMIIIQLPFNLTMKETPFYLYRMKKMEKLRDTLYQISEINQTFPLS